MLKPSRAELYQWWCEAHDLAMQATERGNLDEFYRQLERARKINRMLFVETKDEEERRL